MIKTFTRVMYELEKEYSFNVTTEKHVGSIECDTVLKDDIEMFIAFYGCLIEFIIETEESVLYHAIIDEELKDNQHIEILELIQKEIEKVLK